MSRRRSQRGQTVVESAITLWVFLIFIFAILEFGRAFNIYQVLTNAAREGARLSVAPQPGTSTLPPVATVTTMVCDFLNSAAIQCGGAGGATVSVNQALSGGPTCPVVNGVSPVCTEVDVSAPYQFVFFPFGTITMQTKAAMRNENN